MATLIRVETKTGKIRRCDAKCYNAKHSKCKCVCGGKNHGVGFIQAYINTTDMKTTELEKLYADYLKEKKGGMLPEEKLKEELADANEKLIHYQEILSR